MNTGHIKRKLSQLLYKPAKKKKESTAPTKTIQDIEQYLAKQIDSVGRRL